MRQQLGIPMHGVFAEGTTRRSTFRPTCWPITWTGRLIEYRLHNARITGGLFAMDGRDHWRLNARAGPRIVATFDPERCLRAALGDEIPFTILGEKPWSGHRAVAERYRDGRVFLIGDAAHLLWPLGGFGKNTAIGDAVDLAWKLAARVAGWGGPAGSRATRSQRRPIGVRNVEEAATIREADTQIPVSPVMDEDSAAGARLRQEGGAPDRGPRARKEFAIESPGIDLGYRYDDSPIGVADARRRRRTTRIATRRRPAPGRAPHVWLRDGRSTLDLFGQGYTLLRLGGRAADTAALEAAARAAGVPLAALDLDEPVVEAYERPLVLVRPDGHVAWRGDAAPRDPATLIDRYHGAAPGRRSPGTPSPGPSIPPRPQHAEKGE